MTLLIRIFDVVKPAVRVDLSSLPTVNLVRSLYSLCSLMSTTNEPYVALRPGGMLYL
jgi:hypothetical protein